VWRVKVHTRRVKNIYKSRVVANLKYNTAESQFSLTHASTNDNERTKHNEIKVHDTNSTDNMNATHI